MFGIWPYVGAKALAIHGVKKTYDWLNQRGDGFQVYKDTDGHVVGAGGSFGSTNGEVLFGNLVDKAKEIYQNFTGTGSDDPEIRYVPTTPAAVDYYYADLAKHYGMSKETAYQEALSNTAYERAVKDMQRAGLNPAAIFDGGKGYTASGVSYVSGAGNGRSYGGSSSSNDYPINNGLYNGIATAAGLAATFAVKNPALKVSAYWIGSSAAKGVLKAVAGSMK